MDTECIEIRMGVWEFTAGEYMYQYEAGRAGLNLSFADPGPNQIWTPLLYCKNLDNAVMWAWGFDAGTKSKGNK